MTDPKKPPPSEQDAYGPPKAIWTAAHQLVPYLRMTTVDLVDLLTLIRHINLDMKEGSVREITCRLCWLARATHPVCKDLACPEE